MKIINKKAYYDYFVLQEFVAGLVLLGSEVKSLRRSDVNFGDSYIIFKDGEVFIKNMRIAKYKEATFNNHDEMRDKKLLLNRKEIKKLSDAFNEKGVAIIPLEILIINNRFKLKIGICRGKKNYDRRETIKKRDVERENQRKF